MTVPPHIDYPPKPEAVYLFGTCLVDLFYPAAGLAAVELIEREGVRVIYPQGQTCCGQPPFNSGYREEARTVAAAQMALFPKPIPVVVPSGSCGAMMRVHYPHLFEGAGETEATARAFAGRVFEWSEFMVHVLGVRLRDRGAPVKATYHPSCHLLRELKVGQPPLDLLGQLDRVELLPLADAMECCGFGGTFSLKHPDISGAMVRDKVASACATGCDRLVSADCGCLLNIGHAADKSGAALPVEHLASFTPRRWPIRSTMRFASSVVSAQCTWTPRAVSLASSCSSHSGSRARASALISWPMRRSPSTSSSPAKASRRLSRRPRVARR